MNTRSLMAWLGYAGLLPFYASALWVWLPAAPGRALAANIFIVYGAVILAFLGGTLWGNAVVRPVPQKYVRIVLSNVVALFAAVAGLVGNQFAGALLLALGQVTLLAYEHNSAARRGWYLQLRTRLTVGVLPAHLLYAVALVR